MKAHVIPKFYLEDFTDPDTPENQMPYVWLLPFKEPAWRKRAPKNIAKRTDYYIVNDRDGAEQTGFEDALSFVETKAAPLIRNKIAQRQDMNDSDREILAHFCAIMEARLPDRIERFGKFMVEIGNIEMALYRQAFSQNPSSLEEIKRQYQGDTGRHDLDNLTREALNPEHVELRANKAAVLRDLFSCTEIFCNILLKMGWNLLVSSPPHWFISSDNPCTMFDPMNPAGPFPGLANPSIEITFPLNSQTALLASWKNEGAHYIDVPPSVVRQANIRTALRAREFIVSPSQNFPGVRSVMRYLEKAISPK
jgi:hypothetical protein